jgi:hypothetical protein
MRKDDERDTKSSSFGLHDLAELFSRLYPFYPCYPWLKKEQKKRESKEGVPTLTLSKD